MTIYNFTVKRGDTYNGAEFTLARNGEPLSLIGAHFLCQFKKASSLSPSLTWTELSGISLVPAALDNKFKFNSQIIDIQAGSYIYDIQTTFANSEVKTYIRGTMTVTEDISRV